MASFNYKLELSDGSVKDGKLDAPDKAAAKKRLESMGKVIKLKEEGGFSFQSLMDPNDRSISKNDLFLFTKYFSILLKAGIAVVKCLRILQEQMPNVRMKKKIDTIMKDVESGSSLYEAFHKHNEVFDNMYLSLIEVGEEAGLLYEVFTRLMMHIQKNLKLKGKVKSAMIYPAVIAIVAGGVVVFLLSFVIPSFGKIFKSFGGKLPAPTRFLLALSGGMQVWALPGIIMMVIMFMIFGKWRGTPKGRRITDNMILKLPMFGYLTIVYNVTQFSNNLSILLGSGVTISKAIAIVERALENVMIKESIAKASKDIESGKSVRDAFDANPYFPQMAKQMITVGDETGNLEDMLTNVADFYEEEVEKMVEAVTGLIEPAFIIFLGGTVGFIVIAMFFPMFQMGKMVNKG